MLYLLMIWVWCQGNLSAQELIGWRVDDYAGINNAVLQPAAPVNMPLEWDINIFEGSLFLSNNYAYLSRTGVLPLLGILRRGEPLFTSELQLDSETATYQPGRVTFNYYNGDRRRFGYVSASFLGPSFSYRFKERTRLGVLTRFRAMGSGMSLDGDFSYFPYHARHWGTENEFEVSKMNLASAMFTQVGFNISHAIPRKKGQWNVGATLNLIGGLRGAYFRNLREFQYHKVDSFIIAGTDPLLHAGYTTDFVQVTGYRPKLNGYGFGLDFGVQYLTGKRRTGEYRWKLGFSLLDAGRIYFSRNSSDHVFTNTQTATVNGQDYRRYAHDLNRLALDLDELVQKASLDIQGDPEASRVGDGFPIRLPTAVSLQADYAFTRTTSLNAMAMFNLPTRQGLERGSLIALVPHTEHQWFSMAMPLKLYNWQQLHVGMSLRLGPLLIGTDNLGAIVGQRKFSGVDFYAGLKVMPIAKKEKFRITKSRKANPTHNKGKVKKNRYKGSQAKKRAPDCPKFLKFGWLKGRSYRGARH